MKYGIALNMPSTERVKDIVVSILDNHVGERISDDTLHKIKTEIFEVLMAESDVVFNPAYK